MDRHVTPATPTAGLTSTVRADRMKSRIALLLHDPFVAERVRRRLASAAERAEPGPEGVPLCLRGGQTARLRPAILQIKSARCRTLCGSIDCLCGQYPRELHESELTYGRAFELDAR
jgi:hypothetical protein